MRSVIWFYLFLGLIILNISYLFKGNFSTKNIPINAFEIINTDTLENIIEYSEVSLDRFHPIIIPKSGYVEKGELFEANVIIGATSSEYAKTSSISINGQRVSLNENGVGYFSETAISLGSKRLNASTGMRSPLSGEKLSGSSSFTYYVGEKMKKQEKIWELTKLIRQKEGLGLGSPEELLQYYLDKYNK